MANSNTTSSKASLSSTTLHHYVSQLSTSDIDDDDDDRSCHSPGPCGSSESSHDDQLSIVCPEDYDIPSGVDSGGSDNEDDAKAPVDPGNPASNLVRYVTKQASRMSKALKYEPKKYLSKISGAIGGGSSHYPGWEVAMQSSPHEAPNMDAVANAAAPPPTHFHEHFGFPDSEELLATHFATLRSLVPTYGRIYLSTGHICFRGLVPYGNKIVFPLDEIEAVTNCKSLSYRDCRLAVNLRRHPDYFFDFRTNHARDECAQSLRELIHTQLQLEDSASEKTVSLNAAALEAAQQREEIMQQPMKTLPVGSPFDSRSKSFDDSLASVVDFKPSEPLRFTCLTIGSRGDVQPYIALCKGLMVQGHKCKIATHKEFEFWVRSYGIDFAPIDGEPTALIHLCIQNGMFTPAFLRKAATGFSNFISALLESSKEACSDTDVLIESPSAMAGMHIAEALQIPYFRAFTMPWTKTEVYPHAFAVPPQKMGALYNKASYFTFDRLFWLGICMKVNNWRKTSLGLGRSTLDNMCLDETPFLYNFSPSVVPPPTDFPDCVHVTGYWFLDEGGNYSPPRDLAEFLNKARQEEKKIVYIGFGSMLVDDAAAMTRTVIDAVSSADVRCILSKGWADRNADEKDKEKSQTDDIPIPPEIFQIKSAPHDWLFKKVDVAVHHGGAGTTGASLRAGVPTIVKPFFGDQFFFGQRVEDLGVGVYLNGSKFSKLPEALKRATTDERMIQNSKRYGRLIRKENGVQTAIETIYRELERAKTASLRRAYKSSSSRVHKRTSEEDLKDIMSAAEMEEGVTKDNSWTLVDESDAQ